MTWESRLPTENQNLTWPLFKTCDLASAAEPWFHFLWHKLDLTSCITSSVSYLSSGPYFFPSLYGFLPYVKVSFPLVHVFDCYSLGTSNLL